VVNCEFKLKEVKASPLVLSGGDYVHGKQEDSVLAVPYNKRDTSEILPPHV
jgi:hypothetical protein